MSPVLTDRTSFHSTTYVLNSTALQMRTFFEVISISNIMLMALSTLGLSHRLNSHHAMGSSTGFTTALPNLITGLRSMWASQPLHPPGYSIISMTVCAKFEIATPRFFRPGNMLLRPPTFKHLSMALLPLEFPTANDGSTNTTRTQCYPRSLISF